MALFLQRHTGETGSHRALMRGVEKNKSSTAHGGGGVNHTHCDARKKKR